MFSNLNATDIILLLLSIVVSLVIHETMHGYMAFWLGDDTAMEAGRLSFNPLKHIDPLTTIIMPAVLIIITGIPFLAAKPVPFNPNRVKYGEYGAALVGIIGPLTNLALAVIAAIFFRLFFKNLGSLAYQAVIIFAEVNVAMFIFNMIPFPPLDGSRLLYAFAPEPLRELMAKIEAAGFITALFIIFLLFYVISGPIYNLENGLMQLLFG